MVILSARVMCDSTMCTRAWMLSFWLSHGQFCTRAFHDVLAEAG
jgi:hypothetical protein